MGPVGQPGPPGPPGGAGAGRVGFVSSSLVIFILALPPASRSVQSAKQSQNRDAREG